MSWAFILQKVTSRKFLLGIAGLILAVLNDPAGLDMSAQAQVALASSPALAIISEGLVDLMREFKKR